MSADHPTATVFHELFEGHGPGDIPTVGLVLGAGAARGWAHIGVLRALDAMRIPIDIVTGCSSGALVGAAYALDRLDQIEAFARSLNKWRLFRHLDFSLMRGLRGGGLIEGRTLLDFFDREIGGGEIEDMPRTFGAVATEFGSGREMWFGTGPIRDAVRASIALPGLMTPVFVRDRWMMDGALANPLPITLCRALGADIVIAVDLARDFKPMSGPVASGEQPPSFPEVIGDSLMTMQNFITRVRLAADPPDIVIKPDVAGIASMEFHRAPECIERGLAAVETARDDLRKAVPPRTLPVG